MAAPMPLEQEETDNRNAWTQDALDLITAAAVTGIPFTVDRLYAAGLRDAPHPNMVGPVFRTATARGWIKPTGAFRKSARRTRRRAWVAEYQGTPHMINPNLGEEAA